MDLQQWINDTLKLCEKMDKRLLGEWERGYLQAQKDTAKDLQKKLDADAMKDDFENVGSSKFFK